jgi:hypothetical protein
MISVKREDSFELRDYGLSVMTMNIIVFWDVAPCNLVRRTNDLEENAAAIFIISTLRMEVVMFLQNVGKVVPVLN